MSKLDEYRAAVNAHEELEKFFNTKHAEPCLGRTFDGKSGVAFPYTDRTVSRFHSVNERFTTFIARACQEYRELLVARAMALSIEHVKALRDAVEEETIETIRASGAANKQEHAVSKRLKEATDVIRLVHKNIYGAAIPTDYAEAKNAVAEFMKGKPKDGSDH